MNPDYEDLDERYLEVALRDQAGPRVDLTQRVLRAAANAASVRQRGVPLPRRRPLWRPLAAAAAVILAAGVSAYALLRVLPQMAPGAQSAQSAPLQPAAVAPAQRQASPALIPALPAANGGQDTGLEPSASSTGRDVPQRAVPEERQVRWPIPEVTEPVPPSSDKPTVEGPRDGSGMPPGMTDPPDAWPGRVTKPTESPGESGKEPAAPAQRLMLCRDFKPSRKDGIKVASGKDWRVLVAGSEIISGDRIKVTGWADFTLLDGTLLRLDGEMVLQGQDGKPDAELLDGALYADTSATLQVRHEALKATVSGITMMEQRLHSLEVACLQGSVTCGPATLGQGRTARLGSEGFSREKAVSFADLQRENRFLKDVPARQTLREDFNDAPGEITGGAIKDGVLVGKGDAETGTIVALRKPVTLRGNEVVRLRFRVDRRTEVVLQFGTAQGNYRHIELNPEPGKWQEVEIPIRDFFKATDPASRLGDGLALLRFQMHDNEAAELGVEVDWLEVLSRP